MRPRMLAGDIPERHQTRRLSGYERARVYRRARASVKISGQWMKAWSLESDFRFQILDFKSRIADF
jgi:hypothetical protein